MRAPVIQVGNLGKKYRLGVARHDTLRDRITHVLSAPFQKARNGDADDFWALSGVSFNVNQGDVLGIVGRNGAGKSTLLKILSRITEPTTGRVTIQGRVASLLEVGTGFHPELSGRENIFLNGAILGMSRAEIRRKFDEIVAFAEVERFLDTPVKHYSSGMYVRLAFAVAAHLEPEILIVDEVLAVGDAAFQRKCLGKMGEVASEGRTILFVSHNMAAVTNLCSRALWIDQGRIVMDSEPNLVISRYHSRAADQAPDTPFAQKRRRYRSDAVEMLDFQVRKSAGNSSDQFDTGDALRFRFVFRARRSLPNLALGFYISTADGTRIVYGDSNPVHAFMLAAGDGEEVHVECSIDHLWLTAGTYHVDAIVSNGTGLECLEYVEHAAQFTVVKCSPFGTGHNLTSKVAPIVLPHSWARIP